MQGRDLAITACTSDRSVTSPPRRISGAAHGDPACARLARLAPPPKDGAGDDGPGPPEPERPAKSESLARREELMSTLLALSRLRSA